MKHYNINHQNQDNPIPKLRGSTSGFGIMLEKTAVEGNDVGPIVTDL
jgi:hypothetical protein